MHVASNHGTHVGCTEHVHVCVHLWLSVNIFSHEAECQYFARPLEGH